MSYIEEIAKTSEAIEKLVRQLRKGDAHLSSCCEAGPCGYGIHRQLSDLGWDCQVVGPSLIPRKAGERVKPNRRDSLMLALASGRGLDSVGSRRCAGRVARFNPSARGHEAPSAQSKRRLCAFQFRYGKCYGGKSDCTQARYRWLEEQLFGQSVQQILFQEYVDIIKPLSKRIDGLDTQLENAVSDQCSGRCSKA